MEVLIRNDSPTGEINEQKLEERARKVLSALGCEDAEISVWLASDEDIRELHRDYFGLDTPTNVISFAQRDGEFADVEPEMLGDVVVSYETARRDALEAGTDPEDEVAFLLIHGILHLVGYDHEGDRKADAPEMEEKEAELYKLILGQ